MHALACLAAIVLGASSVDVPLGAHTLPLEVTLDVRTAGAPVRAAGRPFAWRAGADGALEGSARGAGFEAEIALLPEPGGARTVDVAVRWTAPSDVERVAIRLAWPGAPRAVSRALSFDRVARGLRVGRGTPLLVAAGGAVLTGGPGLEGAVLEGGRDDTSALLLLDDAAERPFSTYEACLDRLPSGDAEHAQAIPWAALERRRAVLGVPRRPGDVDRARATLHPLAPDRPFVPVVVERWPRGARAAVVFTDHADRTDAAALRAVLWGSSDPRAGGGVGAGFLGRGVALTRTFFVHARRGGLDDPEIRLLADDLAAAGSEVALHSITGERDDRDAVRAGLAAVAAWRPATWIDHQPYTNCEALSSRGAGTSAPWGVRDLLLAGGIRWGWAAGDVDGRAGSRIVNLLGGDPAAPRPAVFPLPGEPRLWLFRSSMFYASPQELAAALSDAALAELEAERGLFVAHTYLGASAETTRGADHLSRLAVRPAGGVLVLDPALDAALARIAARVRVGRLASLTWVAAGDRLRALGDVEVVYLADGGAEIRNHGDAPIPGLTVSLPAAGLDVEIDGALLGGREDEAGWARVWFDLGAGSRVVLRASDRLVPVPLLPFR